MIIREVLQQLLEIIREVLQQLLEIIRVVLQQVLQVLREVLLWSINEMKIHHDITKVLRLKYQERVSFDCTDFSDW